MNIAELFVRLSADTSGLKKGMTDGARSMDALRTVALRLGGVLGAGVLFRGIIKNSIEAQDALAQLQARIQSTGGAAGRSVEQLTAHAAALQSVTTFGDEAIQSAQALLLTFKRIRGEEFDRATAATLDLATAMGGDLKGAALQLGKALEDPVRGLTALRRSGVSFTDAQRDMIKAMVQAGDVAGAQNLILNEMQTQFGGAAEAARNTLGGALKFLSNQWGDMFEVSKEASGGIIKAINGIGEALPEVRKGMDAFLGTITATDLKLVAAVGGLGLATSALRSMAAAVVVLNAGLSAGGVGLIIKGAGLSFGLGLLIAKLVETRRELRGLGGELESSLSTNLDLLSAFRPDLYAKLPPIMRGFTVETEAAATEAARLSAELAAATAASAAIAGFFAANPVGKMEVAFETSGINTGTLDSIVVAAERGRTAMQQLGDATVSMSGRGVDAFIDFASGAEDAMGNFVRAAMRDLAKLLAKMAIIAALKAAIGGGVFGAGAFAHGLLGSLEKRAGGGPVRGGRPYLVGERGPEMFVPSGSGSIVPSGGGAAITLPPLPRPMTPTEAATQVWFIEAVRIITRNNAERG